MPDLDTLSIFGTSKDIPSLTDLPLPKHIWWPWEQPVERVGFVCRFSIDEKSPARLYVACSGEYQAWLDGSILPVPSLHMPSWRSMHIIPLELSAGEHRLYFEACSGRNQQPFLMANLDWTEQSGARRLATDAAWMMTAEPAPGWVGAFRVEFPFSPDWRPAWAFDGVWAEPWGLPCNAPDDFCRLATGWQTFYAEPLTFLAHLHPGAASLGAAVHVGEDGSLTIHPPLPFPVSLPRLDILRPRLEWYRTREAHSIINNTWLDLFETRCPHAIFDTGVETFARLRLKLRSGGPAYIAITTGESLNEVNRYARRVTDVIELQDGETFATAPTGFRFAKVMVLSAGSQPVVLEPIEAQHIRYPVNPPDSGRVNPRGKFRCSDPDLNAIFDLSVRTVHLCMQTEIWDGIKRDQLPWMGDLYTEALAVYSLFGDYRLARRSLAVLAEIGPAPGRPLEEQRYPGLRSIWKTAGGDINDIPSYTLWWLVGLWDYCQYSGDVSLVEELAVEIEATLQHIAGWVDAEGYWRQQAGWDFVDWSPLSAGERTVYCHLLACRALHSGIQLLEAVGKPSSGYRVLHARMAASARRAWWREGTASFGDSHHVNAQAICSGILSTREAQSLFVRSLQPDPPLSMTYWHRFLDLTAASQVGEITWGLNYIRRHWGQALQVGMTTLWEAFDPAWLGDDPHAVSMIGAGYARYGGYETSLCHGWSAGPAVWLMAAVLGVSPAAPGFTKIVFNPNLGDLEWAEGAIPTPQGAIHVYLSHCQDHKPVARLSVPDGVEIVIPDTVQQHWVFE
jgi:hypothetical protein